MPVNYANTFILGDYDGDTLEALTPEVGDIMIDYVSATPNPFVGNLSSIENRSTTLSANTGMGGRSLASVTTTAGSGWIGTSSPPNTGSSVTTTTLPYITSPYTTGTWTVAGPQQVRTYTVEELEQIKVDFE